MSQRSIEGVGRVFVDGQDIGSTKYRISASRGGQFGPIMPSGSIEADGAVFAAITSSKQMAVLVLESGDEVAFIMRTVRGNRADISISGPVPGLG